MRAELPRLDQRVRARDRDVRPVRRRCDAAGTGRAGTVGTADFTTLPLTRIAGTDVFGYVYDSYNTNPDGSNIPIVGATVRLDALPGVTAVTDSKGYFILKDMPAPSFYVHVDGTTAASPSPGTVYPTVGKQFMTVPGQTVQLTMNGSPFNVYLPPMTMADAVPLAAGKTTVVGFGAGGKAELAAMLPGVDPSVFDAVKVSFTAGSAIDGAGRPATMGAIIPVPPSRLPGPLPAGQDPKLVISIQALGPNGQPLNNPTFDVPASVTFPNLDGLKPGDKSLIWSYSHDAGQWLVVGTGTVSADGKAIVSDGGVIRAPGWHFTAVGTFADGSSCHESDKLDPAPPKLKVEDQDAIKGDKVIYFGMAGVTESVSVSNTGGQVLHIKSSDLKLDGDGAKYFEVMTVDSCTEAGGSIKVRSLDPKVTDKANWQKLEGPTFYSTTLSIGSDGGTERLTLVSFIDAGDSAVDGKLEVNTTTKGATRKAPITVTGPAAGSVSFAAPGAPFGLSGTDLTFASAGAAATGKLPIDVNGKKVGEVPLSAKGIAAQPLGLARADFLAKIRALRNNKIVTDSTDPQYADFAAFRTLFPDATDKVDPATKKTPFETLFDSILKSTNDFLKAGGFDGLYSIDDTATGGGTVVAYTATGISATTPAAVGESFIDFPDATTFQAFVSAAASRTKGETLFQFREMFNKMVGGVITLFLKLEAKDFSGSMPTLSQEIADTVDHEFVHTIGGIHDEKAGRELVNPFGNLSGKETTLGLHSELNTADTQTVYDHYTAHQKPGVAWKGEQILSPNLTVDGVENPDELSLDFGRVAADGAGGRTAERTVVLGNVDGTADFTAGDWALTGPFTFVTAPANGLVVPRGGSVPLRIAFDPAVKGPASGQLTFTTDDPLKPTVTVSLVGTGQAPTAALSIDASALNFDGQTVGGAQDVVRQVVVTNTGLQPLQVGSVAVTGGTTSYRIVNPQATPFAIAPGASQTVQVAFRAGSVGLVPGRLEVASNDPDAPKTAVTLVGTGLSPTAPTDFKGAYIAILTQSGLVLRNRLPSTGDFQFILPVDQEFSLVLFDPKSGLVSHAHLVTGASASKLDMKDLFFSASTAPDTDGDGLPDDAEFAVGTDPKKADTNGDGINDLASVIQGLDPLSGSGVFPTGVIASLALKGPAKDVVLQGATDASRQQLAYVATGAAGLAIVDASKFNNPIVLGQLALPGGDATGVGGDSTLKIAAVADGAGGLRLVDVSDPMAPVLKQTVNVNASHVVVADGIAYVAAGIDLQAFDLASGAPIQTLAFNGGTITGLARDGLTLYTMDNARVLRVVDVSGAGMTARGSLTLGNGGGQVFAGNGVAYAPASDLVSGGFSTIDVSNPDSPKLVAGPGAPGTAKPGTAVAANGSGIGLVVGASSLTGGFQAVDVVGLADSKNNYSFLTRFNLPAAPSDVAIASGIAYVADGTAGLQVINYLPFDAQGKAPTVAVNSNAVDVDPNTPGVQVLEGSTISLNAAVSDDVQVRNVELLVNGRVVRNNVSFPFDLTTQLPTLASLAAGQTTVTVQVRATDTGGNTTLSAPVTLNLVRDTIPPTLTSLTPADGATRPEGARNVTLKFSKPIVVSGALTDVFKIVGAGADGKLGTADDVTIPVTSSQLRDNDTTVQLTTGGFVVGGYEIVFDKAKVTDRPGNSFGAGTFTSRFSVVPFNVSPDFLPFGSSQLTLTDDVEVSIGPMPFAFDFFGKPVSGNMYLTSNAIIEFGTQAIGGRYTNTPLPFTGFKGVAAYWNDLYPPNAPPGSIGYYDGDGVRAITYQAIPYYSRGKTPTATFQIAFYANGTVIIRYGAMGGPPQGGSATIGLTDGTKVVAPSLGKIENQPTLGLTDAGGLLNTAGLAKLNQLSGRNNMLVFIPDGSGGYTVTFNPTR